MLFPPRGSGDARPRILLLTIEKHAYDEIHLDHARLRGRRAPGSLQQSAGLADFDYDLDHVALWLDDVRRRRNHRHLQHDEYDLGDSVAAR